MEFTDSNITTQLALKFNLRNESASSILFYNKNQYSETEYYTRISESIVICSNSWQHSHSVPDIRHYDERFKVEINSYTF
jgi:hypothetical protein